MQKEDIGLVGVWTFTLKNVLTGKIRRIVQNNIIPTVGRQQIAKAISGALIGLADIEANYTSLGTGVTPPANSDVKLETEVYRKNVASATNDQNKLYLTAFYEAAEVTGTFKEAGIHLNGTGTPDSGVLFSRVAIDITKSGTETLTIDYEVTIT